MRNGQCKLRNASNPSFFPFRREHITREPKVARDHPPTGSTDVSFPLSSVFFLFPPPGWIKGHAEVRGAPSGGGSKHRRECIWFSAEECIGSVRIYRGYISERSIGAFYCYVLGNWCACSLRSINRCSSVFERWMMYRDACGVISEEHERMTMTFESKNIQSPMFSLVNRSINCTNR